VSYRCPMSISILLSRLNFGITQI